MLAARLRAAGMSFLLRAASHFGPLAEGGESRVCAPRKPHDAGYQALAPTPRYAWLPSDRGCVMEAYNICIYLYTFLYMGHSILDKQD